ncbi:hypothetical protein EI427_22265 [Flammeovirga pectinis]|uniref:Multidrug transporter n=1 Tax=Flammeovirga pectinis TaxID=2494373 RepID=A0A3S9P9R6_9BACT|nr:bestrophin family ion channel [Flammeovirga pectinis]AZQ64951.1 hypothetical protein EI427_22265 [Flammeovirga pectinis]
MIVNKNLSFRNVLSFTWFHIVWIICWVTFASFLFQTLNWKFLSMPWLPISIIGTAVSFYVGFKNNQSYDRLWEARKIWGGIINSSRKFGAMVKSYVSDLNVEATEGELYAIKKRLIYRHIAWNYVLRKQLLVPTPWEHLSQGKTMNMMIKKRMKDYGIGLVDNNEIDEILSQFLDTLEKDKLLTYKNVATQLIDLQAQDLLQLRKAGLIDDFRHMELQKILNDFYDYQGKCERIKKFPLPRQYGGMSGVFVGIFIFLLPFGMIPEFEKFGHIGGWLAIPATSLIAWVFLMMELVGDYSENPFEGLGNDIPMMSLCRVIEIDLRDMLDEKDLPEPIKAKKGILM